MRTDGFTLVEVLVASIILALGLMGLLASFSQCQRAMVATKRFETAQTVLNYGEMAHPVPPADQVKDDPLKNDLLNIKETDAQELIDDLELDLPRATLSDLEGYTFERTVDDIDQDELKRNGYLYTLRTTVKWGGGHGEKPDEETVVRFWRKK